jgi:hypothetical protein
MSLARHGDVLLSCDGTSFMRLPPARLHHEILLPPVAASG